MIVGWSADGKSADYRYVAVHGVKRRPKMLFLASKKKHFAVVHFHIGVMLSCVIVA